MADTTQDTSFSAHSEDPVRFLVPSTDCKIIPTNRPDASGMCEVLQRKIKCELGRCNESRAGTQQVDVDSERAVSQEEEATAREIMSAIVVFSLQDLGITSSVGWKVVHPESNEYTQASKAYEQQIQQQIKLHRLFNSGPGKGKNATMSSESKGIFTFSNCVSDALAESGDQHREAIIKSFNNNKFTPAGPKTTSNFQHLDPLIADAIDHYGLNRLDFLGDPGVPLLQIDSAQGDPSQHESTITSLDIVDFNEKGDFHVDPSSSSLARDPRSVALLDAVQVDVKDLLKYSDQGGADVVAKAIVHSLRKYVDNTASIPLQVGPETYFGYSYRSLGGPMPVFRYDDPSKWTPLDLASSSLATLSPAHTRAARISGEWF